MKLDNKKIIIETRGVESEEENNSKDDSSDDEESIVYSRRDSNKSNVSNSTDDSIESLTEQLDKKLTVTTDNKKSECPVECLTDKLKSVLTVAEDTDFKERQPTLPYVLTSTNHYSGGTFLQQHVPEQINYAEFSPFNSDLSTVASTLRSSASSPDDNIPQLTITQPEYQDEDSLSGCNQNEYVQGIYTDIYTQNFCGVGPQDVSDYFNSLAGSEPVVNPEPVENFSASQVSPYSFSSESMCSFNSDMLSPHSYQSVDTYSHRSGSSELNSCQKLPLTLPNSSDEEDEDQLEAAVALRSYIDENFKDRKKEEWILASNSEEHQLCSNLRNILYENTRFTNNKLVKVYAIVSILPKMSRQSLIRFFLTEKDILICVIRKNNPLLLNFIVEVMQSLNLCLDNIVANSFMILKETICQPQDMRETLKTMLSLKTKQNKLVFDINFNINGINSNYFTIVHEILRKIGAAENIEIQNLLTTYLEIFLNNNVNLNIKTSEHQTYLHYAILSQCGPQVVKMILEAANKQKLIDFINLTDSQGICALRMVSCLKQHRKEVENILLRWHDDNIYHQNIIDFNNF